MKRYIKDKKIKFANQIVIKKDGKQIINPSEDMILADGWVEYIYVELEKTIQDYKNEKLEEIKHYDESSSVNEFYIQGIPVWLDKTTRVGLKLRFESEKVMGQENTTLWYNNQEFVLLLDNAIQMLYAIEVYASKCYDNTQRHISEVSKLENKEEIEIYDYRTGYPEKLFFNN